MQQRAATSLVWSSGWVEADCWHYKALQTGSALVGGAVALAWLVLLTVVTCIRCLAISFTAATAKKLCL